MGVLTRRAAICQYLGRSLTSLLASLDWVDFAMSKLSLCAATRVAAAGVAAAARLARLSASAGLATLLACLRWVDLALSELEL